MTPTGRCPRLHITGECMNKKTIFALGFFDGVHLGHAALLQACRRLGEETGCDCGVVTFHNHPDALVHGTAPGLINTTADRDWLLERWFAMDRIVSLPFDRALMNCPWEVFFRRLVEEFGAAGLVCGADFRFGKRGEGDARKLLAACEAEGIPCRVIDQLSLEGTVVSSTYIRGLIELGNMSRAVEFLGHPHILTGKVIHGHQLGRKLGIPTANLMLPKELVVPRFGVYAYRCRVGEKVYDAVTNIGTRPTVAGIGVTVEPWILDYSGDLYGQEITLEFYRFLRAEKRFESLNAMREEIFRNAREAKEFLKTIPSCAVGKNVVE